MNIKKIAAVGFVLSLAGLRLLAGDPGGGDWPMWGGTADRNLVSSMKGLPISWDVKAKKNVKWVAELGSQTYGNPVVSNGVVLVGTNNEAMQDPAVKGDKGILMAFRESDGQFLWQAVHDKLTAGRANDWPFQGICSSPLVDGGIAYYVSNRGEVMAVDVQGFRDKGENDGPFKDEKQTRETDVDIIWRYDMMDELGVLQHNMANSSPVMFENLIYVSTSNGQDESHVNVPSPKAPAIIALDKNTGKLVWEDASPGEKILHGQWSSPAVGKIGDTVQVVIGQGDGWVRSYEAKTGKKLWEFDMNPKDSVWPKTRNEVISTPVIYENVVYIANGQDPEHGEGVGHLYAIDADETRRYHQDRDDLALRKIRRSISTGAIYNGILFYSDFSGFLHALDVKTGKPFWKHDMFAAIWGSPIVIDGKVYLGDEDGDVDGPQRRSDDEGGRGEQHGELGVLDARSGQRYHLHRQSQRAVRARDLERHDERKVNRAFFFLALAATSALSAQAPSFAPADRWAQFRGSASLTGVSDAKLPDTLKVLWTYEAGDSIESSAAIVDGVVYVGSMTGELHAVNLADGKLKWKYKASPTASASRRRRSRAGSSTSAISAGLLHAVEIADRQGRVDVQDRDGDQVVAGGRRATAS